MAKLDSYKKAFEKAEAVCLRAAAGDLEARITDIEDLGEVAGFLVAINKLLDQTDAFVREAGASLEYASQGKYFRPFLLRGMRGDFRRGAAIIDRARESMETRHDLTEDFQSAVSSVVGVVSDAAGHLQTTAQSMTADAETTHQQSITVAAASEEASSNAQAVAAGTEELSSAIGEIGRQVTESTAATEAAVTEVERATDAVGDLTEAAAKIDKVVSFIRDIAGQTNLLALNATIEAARAGEAGRGFAVVAHEVKALATQVAEATSDVTEQVGAMQRASELTAAAIESINGRINEVNAVATAIASAMEEQSAATSEISQNVQQAAEGSQAVSRNITDISAASEKTGIAAKEVLQSAEHLAAESDSLNNRVADFLQKISQA